MGHNILSRGVYTYFWDGFVMDKKTTACVHTGCGCSDLWCVHIYSSSDFRDFTVHTWNVFASMSDWCILMWCLYVQGILYFVSLASLRIHWEVKVKWFYVVLDREAVRTLLHSHLKLCVHKYVVNIVTGCCKLCMMIIQLVCELLLQNNPFIHVLYISMEWVCCLFICVCCCYVGIRVAFVMV